MSLIQDIQSWVGKVNTTVNEKVDTLSSNQVMQDVVDNKVQIKNFDNSSASSYKIDINKSMNKYLGNFSDKIC